MAAVARPVLRMMSPNCFSVSSRPRALMGRWKGWPAGTGCWPTGPAATCRFWFWMALMTSEAVRLRVASLSGSSQRQCCNRRTPSIWMSPTP